MDDIMSKFQEVLSDEESMKQLSELAQMFSSSAAEEGESSESVDTQSENENSFGNPFGDFDIAKIFQIQQIMSSVSEDKNTGLLLALKPILKEERQHKVDKAIKMLKLYAVWTALKESGMLNDFL